MTTEEAEHPFPIPVEIQYLIRDIENRRELSPGGILSYYRWFRRRATAMDRKVQREAGRMNLGSGEQDDGERLSR